MTNVPLYDLYGESHSAALRDWLHWETIPARSRGHDFAISTHRHAALYQFLRLSHGKGQLDLAGQMISLSVGDVVMIAPRVAHGFRFSSDVDGVIVSLFEQDLAIPGVDLTRAIVVPARIAQDAGLDAALATLLDEAGTRDNFSDIAMRARIHLLIAATGRAAAQLSQIGAAIPPTDPAARDHALAFRALVDARFRESRDIGDYASRLGISATHLGRICRQVLGITPLTAIESRIAREAKRMLVFSDCSVKELAAALGYDDPAYFSRSARRWLGMSPRAFRRSARSVPAAPRS